MHDPHAEARQAVEDAALKGPGRLAAALRQAIARVGPELPQALRALAEKIERHPSQVTAEDVEALKALHSEDEVFELVVSAALGAARRRLDAGLRALEEA